MPCFVGQVNATRARLPEKTQHRGGPFHDGLARKVFCIFRAERCRLFTASPDNRALDSPAPRATAKAPRYRENPKHGPWAPCPEHPILAPRSPLVRFEGKYPCRPYSCRSHFAGLPQESTATSHVRFEHHHLVLANGPRIRHGYLPSPASACWDLLIVIR